jgi:hypothetical protein
LKATGSPTYDGIRTDQAVRQPESSEETRIQLFSFARPLESEGGNSASFGLLLDNLKLLPNLGLFLLPTVCILLFFSLEFGNSALEGVLAFVAEFLNLL